MLRKPYVIPREAGTVAAKGVGERAAAVVPCTQWALLLAPSHVRLAGSTGVPARMYTSLQTPQPATIGRSALPLYVIDGNLAPLHGIRVIWARLKVGTGSRSSAAGRTLPRYERDTLYNLDRGACAAAAPPLP